MDTPPAANTGHPTDADLPALHPDSGPRFGLAGATVDRREVGTRIDNTDSISASLGGEPYEELAGIRAVSMDGWSADPSKAYYAADDMERCHALADTIRASGRIDPLIVIVAADGDYILEGGHRLSALWLLGATAFPALVIETPGAKYPIPTAPTMRPTAASGLQAAFDATHAATMVGAAADAQSLIQKTPAPRPR